ncbi:putative microtubule binding protein [Danaus plexippus plexippus]|uniref:Microtubule binding protein n=1 Tax=Danaus plexippus plexippus TaxID=278856 RepID=A0A212FFR0_DANPL|nr:putative microtubule binding protein [Danaus plexippus plexippus]
MSESVKQVKVDNWGIYFLQRLKHFFNRTDYCDLTLQFQDNAQLKVHRLVLNACTEYFELLERTCEMYEDCLVMPDDLQADVVVPIINFMYTGQLEFRVELLEKLYQTSLIMNMPVLTKLLDGHRVTKPSLVQHYGKKYTKTDVSKILNLPATPSSSFNSTIKRNYSTAFETSNTVKSKKPNTSNVTESLLKSDSNQSGSSTSQFPVFSEKNSKAAKEPRPTRYELPEELDEDNIFDNSFTNISYTSKPLMVHPETVKQYGSKKINLFEEGSSGSSRFIRSSSSDLVECKKISNSNIFEDDMNDSIEENDIFTSAPSNKDITKDSSKLFDQILDSDGPKVTIEAKNKEVNNLDHAKIISEVLKKYPHLVKSNKNIKLKILNTPNKSKKSQSSNVLNEDKEVKLKADMPDFTYETDVIDSKQAAQLIALGVENVKGPWICLICGTPGRALHFTSYYNFRKHLVEVHNEKPVPTICEYCGQKSLKRNYLLHHLLTKHGVEPPSNYHFPRCNVCNYIALNEALLVKHKMTHTELKQFRCNVCAANFNSSNQILIHIQKTGHKYSAERKTNLKCIYCLKVFLRESNLYAHLKTNHKEAAKNDGIVDDSEEEQQEEEKIVSKQRKSDHTNIIKLEVPVGYENTYEENNIQYEIERHPDGNIRVVSKKQRVVLPKHKILNSNYGSTVQNINANKTQLKSKPVHRSPIKKNEFLQETSSPNSLSNDEIVLIDNKEYIVRDYQLIPKKEKYMGEFIMPSNIETDAEENMQTVLPTTSMEYQNIHGNSFEAKMFVKKSNKTNQPVQIVVSNEDEYKALMASHQSVLYEDRDDGKTLAMLATNDHALENRTIDLSNAQSNSMMIIQDDFSMNVPEPVSSENPNIVVVYSHPIEDQKQQYQIITTQAINPQFVQSSAILTQNYETVTTSTPVISAHASVQNAWQNNIPANTITMSTASEIQTMTMAGSLPIAHVENITTSEMNSLPEVHLTSSETVLGYKDMVNATNVGNFNQSNIISSINVQAIEQPAGVITIQQQSDNNISQHTINNQYNQNEITTNIIQTDCNATYASSVSISEHGQLAPVPPVMVPATILASINPTNAIPSLAQRTIITSLDPSTTSANINPTTTIATLDPITNLATLIPTSNIATLDPTTNIATLVPSSTITTLDPTTNLATLVQTSTIATLDPTTNVATIVPATSIATIDPNTNIATLLPAATLDQDNKIVPLDSTTIMEPITVDSTITVSTINTTGTATDLTSTISEQTTVVEELGTKDVEPATDSTTTLDIQDSSTTSIEPSKIIAPVEPSVDNDNLSTTGTVEEPTTTSIEAENYSGSTDTHNNTIEMSTKPSNEDNAVGTDVVDTSEIPLESNVQEEISSTIPVTEKFIEEEVKDSNGPAEEMEVDETIENIAKDIGVSPNTINVHELSSKNPKSNNDSNDLKKVVIESLTSEWSEDESENSPQASNDDVPDVTNTAKDEQKKVVEIEESIENIQQEVDKQISGDVSSIIDESTISSYENTITVVEEKAKDAVDTPQVKITSLLNEWDDNDSPENENTEAVGADGNTDTKSPEHVPEKVSEDRVIENIKDENIKSLVSDWDEEDEENKV